MLEEDDLLKYLGSIIAANGGVEVDVRHRVNEGCKVLGAMKGVVPTVMNGSELWGMKVSERKKQCI